MFICLFILIARIAAARIIIYACAQSQNNWWNEIFKVFEEVRRRKKISGTINFIKR